MKTPQTPKKTSQKKAQKAFEQKMDDAEKMIEDAKSTIDNEKKAAMDEVRNLVSGLSIEIAEKILRENLKDEKSQKSLVDKFLKEAKVN